MVSGASWVGEMKLFSPTTKALPHRGAYVAFGNTKPEADDLAHGRPQRGVPSDGAFDPSSGLGYVSPKAGDYPSAIARGNHVDALLFETYGGYGPGTMRLLYQLAAEVGGKLSAAQFEQTSWSARTWLSYSCQKISIALHLATAHEIASELGIAAVFGTDSRDCCR